MSEYKELDILVVCDKCLSELCWEGTFMCYDNYDAGILEVTSKELLILKKGQK